MSDQQHDESSDKKVEAVNGILQDIRKLPSYTSAATPWNKVAFDLTEEGIHIYVGSNQEKARLVYQELESERIRNRREEQTFQDDRRERNYNVVAKLCYALAELLGKTSEWLKFFSNQHPGNGA